MKILSVVGNRPPFVKSAALSIALRAAGVDEVVLHTGQDYDSIDLAALCIRGHTRH
jgi:UDP-N-acetylglucosamine 2-epimerase